MAYARDLVITYGAYVINTANTRDLDGHLILDRDFTTGSAEFKFAVYGTTDANFATSVTEAEAAFRKPFQDFTIVQGAQDLLLAAQSTGTAIDPQPSILKREDVGDTGRSRIYTVRMEYGLQATTGAEPAVGLREVSVDVSFDPASVATINFTGTYTSNTTTGARAQYLATIDAYVTSVMSSLGISNFELNDRPAERQDTNDNLLEFTRIYQQLIHSQAGSSLNDSAIVRQRLSITRNRTAPGDFDPTERLAFLTLSYEAWIDSVVTTDLDGKFNSIRPWLVTQIRNTLSGGQMAIVSETPLYHFDENRISVTMEAQGQVAGQDIIEQRVTVEDDDAKGIEVVPAHTGDPLSAYWFSGPRVIVRTITHIMRRIGTFTVQQALGFAQGSVTTSDPSGAGGGQWLLMRQRPSTSPNVMGLDNDTILFSEMVVTTQLRYVKRIGSTTSGGGGGVVTPSGGTGAVNLG